MSTGRMDDRADRLSDAFRENASDLLAYLQRRIEPREDAADALSEAMVVAWRRVAHLPADPAEARMWLFVVTRNALRNVQRGSRRRTAADDRLRDVLACTPVPEDSADAALDVRAAISRLPDSFAEIVRLVHWDGFSLTEAARICGIPPATARSRYARARARLARELQPETHVNAATALACS